MKKISIETVIATIDARRNAKEEFKLFNDEIRVIVSDFKKKFPKATVLRVAKRDQETPYGTIITWLRDYYHLPKTVGSSVAERILDDYLIDDNGNPIPKYATHKSQEFIGQFIHRPSAQVRDDDGSVKTLANVIASDDMVDIFTTLYPLAEDLDDRYDNLCNFVQTKMGANIWPGESIL